MSKEITISESEYLKTTIKKLGKVGAEYNIYLRDDDTEWEWDLVNSLTFTIVELEKMLTAAKGNV